MQTFGPQNLSRAKYITGVVEERILTEATDLTHDWAAEIIGQELPAGPTDRQIDRAMSKTERQLVDELIKQLTAYKDRI